MKGCQEVEGVQEEVLTVLQCGTAGIRTHCTAGSSSADHCTRSCKPELQPAAGFAYILAGDIQPAAAECIQVVDCIPAACIHQVADYIQVGSILEAVDCIHTAAAADLDILAAVAAAEGQL